MKSLSLLAKKYQQINTEQTIENTSATALLEHFIELAKTEERDVLIAFKTAIQARERGESLVQESAKFKNADIEIAALALEKVLNHFHKTQDKQFCRLFEQFAQGNVNLKTEGPLMNKIGSAIGRGVGGISKAAGAVAGGAVGAWDAAKKGFTAGRNTVAGTTGAPSVSGTPVAPATPAQAATPAPVANNTQAYQNTAPAQVAAPAPVVNDAQAKVGVGQINKIVQTLRTRDLESIKKNIEQRLAAMAAKRTPTKEDAAPESLVAESVETFYITTNKHFRK